MVFHLRNLMKSMNWEESFKLHQDRLIQREGNLLLLLKVLMVCLFMLHNFILKEFLFG